ncbi:NAD(P)H-binding protein [Piscinibacter sp. HJYY11]|uniref:NAD(P)H-binding protein n=1 Tax=Piscinibacter sp. HJYY11 TaxID=2801333 RepID=UPI00191FE86E|nr:NAD(P)H-binding protein [Piscinibacter sp. HJYY11]MBL0729258.1 NAD-dependent epimerase/dehydratase family protein [Piscinibacter sp. HJYY11]
MKVLLTGATGFIGRHLAIALAQAGHEVVAAVRTPGRALPGVRAQIAGDFTRDQQPADWQGRLTGIDVVVNTVGILREHGAQRFDTLHEAAPIALFRACVAAGVRRVVQLSALGADTHARSRYHLSKKAADDTLLALPLQASVVQPSLVYGPGGASARLFNLLASLPVLMLPGKGSQQVQPIHIDDLVQALVKLIERPEARSRRIALVGPEPLALREFLARLRAALGLPPTAAWPVPMPLVRLVAKAGRWWPGALLDDESLAMLERGNTAPATDTTALLGRPPRPVSQFITREQLPAASVMAQLGWLLPLLRVSIALVWIVTGVLSLGVYPVEGSYALLAQLGVGGALAPLLLYGAAVLDLALGVLTLTLKRHRPLLWLAQIGLILGYTVLITWRLPEFWLHPFGPILKNLPMLAAIALLMVLERRLERPPWNT